MTAPPLPFAYEGQGVFRALPRAVAACAEHYGQGEIVVLAPLEARSLASHNQYFAALNECWLNLPETVALRWASVDHFRKHGLIATGFHDQRSLVCASKAEAARVAAFMRPMDDYAIVTVSQAVVTVYTAKSQSMRAMGRDGFRRSKDEVLGWAAMQAGISLESLSPPRDDARAKNPASAGG